MVPFPTDFPADAVAEVLAFVEKKDHDQKKFVQALYTLLGYGLFTFMGPSGALMLSANQKFTMPSWLIPILEQLATELIKAVVLKS